MSDRDFLSMNKQCTAEIDTARELLSELYAQRESADDLKKHLDTIRQVLKEAERDAVKGVVNKDFVDKFIDRIFATMVDETTMQLQIKIFTGEVTESIWQISEFVQVTSLVYPRSQMRMQWPQWLLLTIVVRVTRSRR